MQASCSVLETPNEASCDVAKLEEKENKDDGDKKFSWTEEDTKKFLDMFKPSDYDWKSHVWDWDKKEHKNLEQNDPEDQENNDNMDDVKIWAINQKQSCNPADFN